MHQRSVSVKALTFLRGWRGSAEAVGVLCDDEKSYVIKGSQAGRQVINDEIVARLGVALGAPVGIPELVEISSDLISIEPRLAHIAPGIAHGTLFIQDCDDSRELIRTELPENRMRLALLSVLYGWIVANDCQFLFRRTPPQIVYSVDHGHFFPRGPDWTIELLKCQGPPEVPGVFTNCYFKFDEYQQMASRLKAVTEQQILLAVATPPDEWGLTMEERLVLVEYLTVRKQQLLSTLSHMSFGSG